jgi:VIT1/CCC1 family predicted Fe2+/Mn2+ transporter
VLARYRRYLLAEWEAAALYRRLADAESDPERAAILRELAIMEDRHAARWRSRLEAAGEPLPQWKPSLRTQLSPLAARVLGTRRVLPILEQLEGEGADMYAAEPAAQDFSLDERSHARVFAHLAGKDAPAGASAIAQGESHHRGSAAGSLRAAVFGVNDGLVSNLSLVMGVAGAAQSPQSILLAGLAGLLAGAFSMATGEYVSMRVQRELFEREIELERAELEENPDEERAELALIYRAKGLAPDEASRLASKMIDNRATALDTLAREELGLNPDELGSPVAAASSSFFSFAIGALLPVLPYLLPFGSTAFLASLVLSGVALAGVGAATSLLTGRSALFGAGRMVGLGLLAAGVTYVIGHFLGVAVAG